MITYEQLKNLVTPKGKKDIIDKVVALWPEYAALYGINTPLRQAHFLAQIAHESDGFNTTKEYGGSKARYAPWFGRGLIQTTWEANYKALTEWCKARGLNNPNFATATHREKVAQFPWAFIAAICYWDMHNLNRLADKDDVDAITKAINGGTNGLEDRKRYLAKAKQIFGVATFSGSTVVENDVVKIQRRLIELGYKIEADGIRGPRTIAAIRLFQKFNGLQVDGIVGPKTSKKLFG